MRELQEYVDSLFRHQRLTPEVKDLKEEILSNMAAKRADLLAQGVEKAEATRTAMESLSSVEGLIDGNQLTDLDRYRTECLQTALRNGIFFWIGTMPLLFTGYGLFCYLGMAVTAVLGIWYFIQMKCQSGSMAFVSREAGERRRRWVWILWGAFFLVAAGTMAALTFGGNLWFGVPPRLDGPYQLANLVSRFYLPLLTIFLPLTVGAFPKLLAKCEVRK